MEEYLNTKMYSKLQRTIEMAELLQLNTIIAAVGSSLILLYPCPAIMKLDFCVTWHFL